MLDPKGNVGTWNSGAANMKQHAADEILGRHFSVFYSPEQVAAGEPERALEPGMSGAQVLPLLRQIDSDVPVIVSTGYDKAEAGRRLGTLAVDFLQKPYTGFQLADKIRNVLGSRKE